MAALLGTPERTLYRVLAGARPTRGDFQSDAELGRDPRGDQVHDRREYEGISMFDRIQDAVKVARRFELGPAIAEVRIPAGRSDIAVHKTRGPHHCSVVGDAAELRALVVQVHPLDSIA